MSTVPIDDDPRMPPLGPPRLPWLAREILLVAGWHRRSLFVGLPALVVGTATLVLAIWLALVPQADRMAPYRSGASTASTSPADLNRALLCSERLIRTFEGEPEYLFRHAQLLEANGESAAAESIHAQLAPVDRPGYPRAHLARARSLVKAARDPAMLRAAEVHLKYAVVGPDGEEAEALLGRLYAATGRGKEAEPYLLTASARNPELWLVLARLAREQGNDSRALAHLDAAARTFQKRVESSIDDVEARLFLATAMMLRPDFPAAVAILEQGLARTRDPAYVKALGEMYAFWADSLARDTSSTPAERLVLVEKGLKYSPNSPQLLSQMLDCMRAGSPEAERVRTLLQARLTDGKATPMVHFVLGVDAITRGREAEARVHWEQAIRLDPGLGAVANNLAWVLAHSDPPDLPRALKLIDGALEQSPNHPEYRGTRGHILMKLRRWSEALTDLEALLAAHPGRATTHRALAEVYARLGSPELSAQHGKKADALSRGSPVATGSLR